MHQGIYIPDTNTEIKVRRRNHECKTVKPIAFHAKRLARRHELSRHPDCLASLRLQTVIENFEANA